jgi:thiol-disulfide isomerase/thioredoxin
MNFVRLFRSRPYVIAAAAVAILAIAIAIILYVIHSSTVHAKPPELAALEPAKAAIAVPAVAFSDALGNRHLLSAYRGRFVLLNLWATWCGPCVKELPALARLQAAIPVREFVVVPVNVGRSSAAETAQFLKAHGAANLPVNTDSSVALMQGLHAYGLPATVLIDSQGREVARAEGPAEWDTPAAIAYFKALVHAAS